MRCTHRFFCALTVLECLIAPHHWAINYMAGLCDTWGIYIKGFVGCTEPLSPIQATFKQNMAKSNNNASFIADFCPKRAQYHTIQILYPLSRGSAENAYSREREMFFDAVEFRSLKWFANAKFRFCLKRKGNTFYSSQWQTIERFAFVHSSSDIYADHPFGRNAIYGELFLDGFDTSLFPWAYHSPIRIELEFRDFDIEAFKVAKAILVIRVYNHLEM